MSERNKEKSAKAKEKRRIRKENGLCATCGRPIDRDGANCKECAAKNALSARLSKNYYISRGVCPLCKKTNIFPWEKSCPECKAKAALYESKSRECNAEKKREIKRNSYHKIRKEREDSGMCVTCGKRKPADGKKNCGICLEKIRESQRRWKQKQGYIAWDEKKERRERGLCFFCGKPVKDGYKTCEEHYQICTGNITSEKANETRRELVKQGILY